MNSGSLYLKGRGSISSGCVQFTTGLYQPGSGRSQVGWERLDGLRGHLLLSAACSEFGKNYRSM